MAQASNAGVHVLHCLGELRGGDPLARSPEQDVRLFERLVFVARQNR